MASYLQDRALTCICGWNSELWSNHFCVNEPMQSFLFFCFFIFYGLFFAVLSEGQKISGIQFGFSVEFLAYRDVSKV